LSSTVITWSVSVLKNLELAMSVRRRTVRDASSCTRGPAGPSLDTRQNNAAVQRNETGQVNSSYATPEGLAAYSREDELCISYVHEFVSLPLRRGWIEQDIMQLIHVVHVLCECVVQPRVLALITKMTCKLNFDRCHPRDQIQNLGVARVEARCIITTVLHFCTLHRTLHTTMSLIDKPGEPSGSKSIPLYVVDGVATVWDAQSEYPSRARGLRCGETSRK